MHSYDYIIVGAGSAGCVLAGRLTEDPDVTVLLLEAGPPDDLLEVRVPGAVPMLFRSGVDWNFGSVPQRHAGGRALYIPRGRTVGGSSSTNAMVYMRGSALDYDTWRDEYGCVGWGYADLLPYFRRSEDQERGESDYHGTGGPIRVEHPRYVHELNQAWVESAVAAGCPENDDFNGARQDGVGFHQFTIRGGERASAADGYLRPAASRPGLAVRTDALVTKVLVEDGRAVGVRFGDETAHAAREVLVCAGAFHSPQLLMLSGIGPAGHLREHGIDVLLDSPRVGKGLQDHVACPMICRTPGVPSLSELATPESMEQWERERQGPMAASIPTTGGFVRTVDGIAAPDLGFHVGAAPSMDFHCPPLPWRGLTVHPIAVDVRSRGQVTLRSSDPADKPNVNPAYLSCEDDLDVLASGVRLARQIAATKPLAGLIEEEYAPGPDVAGDTSLRAWIRRHATQFFHPTGSCAMGASPEAVCDPELRVRGIDGLRVVDASVMPKVPRGNTNAPTIAVAERAADLIRASGR